MIGIVDKNKIKFGKFQIKSKPEKQVCRKEKNSSYQLKNNISTFEIPSSFAISSESFNLLSARNSPLKKNQLLLIDEFYEYMTTFCCKFRNSPPIQSVTADTHKRNILRFVGFVILHFREFINHKIIISSQFDELIYFNDDVISIYIQIHLNNDCGGTYIILILRSLHNFHKFLHSKFDFSQEYEKTSLFIQGLFKSFSYSYVYFTTKQQFDDTNSWIDYNEFQKLALKFNENTQRWSFLSNSLPQCVKYHRIYTNLSDNQKKSIKKNWKNNFSRRKAVLSQENLLSLLLSAIPTPRTSNLKNLCIYFRNDEDNDLKIQLKCYNLGIKSLLQVSNLSIEQISIINDAIQSYFNVKDLQHDQEWHLNDAVLTIRFLSYKTQKHKSNEDIEISITSTMLVDEFFRFIKIGGDYQYLIQNPIMKSKKKNEHCNLINSNFFPMWIDSNGNCFLGTNTQYKYDKISDTRFTMWTKRILYNVCGKNISINSLRKSCVTMSREEKWDDESKLSLATSMMHSIETAEKIYCKIKTIEKTEIACKRISIK